MDCKDCPRFDAEKSLCRDGKVNPPRWEQAVEVATFIGIRAICTMNDHRERLLLARQPEQTPR